MVRNHTSANPDPIDIAVGARIRLHRRMSDVSQTQLADALGITFQQVQKYEKGTNRVSASMLVRAAAALKTTTAALVGEDGQAPVEPVAMAQLATPRAVELLAAFAGITNGDVRRALLTAAHGLAGAANRRAAKRLSV